MLEGHDGVVYKDHVSNCAPCHLPNVDGTIDSSLVVIRVRLRCMLCGSKGGAAHMLVCDRCSKGWHMACMTTYGCCSRWTVGLSSLYFGGVDDLIFTWYGLQMGD
jgi:hypothetical protein